MPLPTSVLLEGARVPLSAGTARVFRAYGEPDDPLRLTVLLAEHLGTLTSANRAPDAVATCMSPRSSWKDRKEALGELFRLVPQSDAPFAVLIDPDGLVQPRALDWEDPGPARMRRDLRSVLREAIDRGGFLLTRPSPTDTLDEELDGVTLISDDAGEHPAAPLTARFAPDVRPIVDGLIARGHFSRERIEDVLEEVRAPDAYVLAIAYDALPETARETARRLSLVRAPSKANGAFGAFAWQESPNAVNEVRQADVETLVRAGFLVADDAREPQTLVMPRRVRSFVAGLARALDGAWAKQVHRALAEDAAFATEPTYAQIEIHHHAARAGDLILATKTARYFGFELRALASEASRVRKDYKAAADLFQTLVDRFDPTDAYAWEYLGYNLARSPDTREESERILAAYERASQLDGRNPLYRGRLLGQRATMGLPVRAQFEQAMQAYGPQGADYVSWFAMPVFDGLVRGKRTHERDELLRSWKNLLEAYAPKVVEKHAPGAK